MVRCWRSEEPLFPDWSVSRPGGPRGQEWGPMASRALECPGAVVSWGSGPSAGGLEAFAEVSPGTYHSSLPIPASLVAASSCSQLQEPDGQKLLGRGATTRRFARGGRTRDEADGRAPCTWPLTWESALVIQAGVIRLLPSRPPGTSPKPSVDAMLASIAHWSSAEDGAVGVASCRELWFRRRLQDAGGSTLPPAPPPA